MPHFATKFEERLDWIYRNRPELNNLNKLATRAGGARATVGNAIRKAHELHREPELSKKTLLRIAAAARVSYSWLMLGTGVPEGDSVTDIPAPLREPLEQATNKMQIKTLRAEVVRLRRELALAKQTQK